MNAEKKVIKHVSLEELQTLIQKEKNKHVFQRLLFIHQLYQGNNVEKACGSVCILKQTGYNWLNRWNTYDYEGLIPHFGGGRPPKLTKEEKEQLKEELKSKGDWMTSEVRALIKKEFGITYSNRQVSRILRSFKMHYAKPYPHDYRRPENAKELLEDSLKKAVNEIQNKCVIGFLDQAAPQTTDNKQRFWSFDKPKSPKTQPSTGLTHLDSTPLMERKLLSSWIAQRQDICVHSFALSVRETMEGIFYSF